MVLGNFKQNRGKGNTEQNLSLSNQQNLSMLFYAITRWDYRPWIYTLPSYYGYSFVLLSLECVQPSLASVGVVYENTIYFDKHFLLHLFIQYSNNQIYINSLSIWRLSTYLIRYILFSFKECFFFFKLPVYIKSINLVLHFCRSLLFLILGFTRSEWNNIRRISDSGR